MIEGQCPNCGFENQGTHWNSSTSLPPVDLPFIIMREGKELVVIRTEYIQSSGKALTYWLYNARGFVSGRYPWRHK